MSRKQLAEMADAVRGIRVLGCVPGSTGAEAGLRHGDIVVSVNGRPTPSLDEYREARKLRSDGYQLVLFRAGEELTVFVPFRPPGDSLTAALAQSASAPQGLPS